MTVETRSLTNEPPRRGRQPCVLQVLPALVTGRVERGAVDVAAALVEAGWTAVVASAGGPMVRELDRVGAHHVQLPLASKNPLVMRANVARLEAVIRDFRVDVVHARSRAPAWSALAAANRTGRRFVTTFHGTYGTGMLGLKKSYNAVMTRGRRVIAISDFIAEHIHSVYGVPSSRIRVIPRGIDMDRFDPARVSAERIIQLARQWRLPEDCPVIMLPGRLTRWKGQTVLIEALALLGRKDVRCLLVGSDQGRDAYREELVSLARSRGLADVVHVVDQCNDMPAAYMLTDVVVSASTEPEAFGRVSVEAQAMGRPVVATEHGGSRETVLPDGETGWLVPPREPAALAAAIARVLALSATEREALAQRSIAHARDQFPRQRMCEQTLQVYAELLSAED
ncbi:MAG: glycosyltransferase family 4 protein [Alphaproteobacteria bacterium]|nr:glycosyltransferase family 4 protein [Alphaproteobacteria bacterium]